MWEYAQLWKEKWYIALVLNILFLQNDKAQTFLVALQLCGLLWLGLLAQQSMAQYYINNFEKIHFEVFSLNPYI